VKFSSYLLTTIVGSQLLITGCSEQARQDLQEALDRLEQDQVEDEATDTNQEQTVEAATLKFPTPGMVITTTELIVAANQREQPMWLDVGTTKGGSDLYNQAIVNGVQVNGIPLNGEPIYITLWTELSDGWHKREYEFATISKTSNDGGSDTGSNDNDNTDGTSGEGGEEKPGSGNDTDTNTGTDTPDQGDMNTGGGSPTATPEDVQAIPATYSVTRGETLNGQLALRTTYDGAWEYALVSQPQYGELSLDAQTGAFTYSAESNPAENEDQFRFVVRHNGIESSVASVDIRLSQHKGKTLQGRSDGVGADLVIVAEGFTQAEMSKFHSAVDDYIDFMFGYEAEFAGQKSAWNIHRIDLVSQQSGSDANINVNTVNTALDSGFNCSNIQRLLCVDTSKTFAVVNDVFPQWDNILVIVNSSTYGGAGYGSGIGTVSLSASAKDVALHEMAHSFAGLGDEYEYGGSSVPTREPSDANLTINNNLDSVKWAHWIGVDNIGLFEGGRYVSNGVWRPTESSMMRYLGAPFYAVNKEAWTLSVYQHSKVLSGALPLGRNVSHERGADKRFKLYPSMDANALDIRWFVNGVERVEWRGETLVEFGRDQQSQYEIKAILKDKTGVIRHDPNQYATQTASWTVSIK